MLGCMVLRFHNGKCGDQMYAIKGLILMAIALLLVGCAAVPQVQKIDDHSGWKLPPGYTEEKALAMADSMGILEIVTGNTSHGVMKTAAMDSNDANAPTPLVVAAWAAHYGFHVVPFGWSLDKWAWTIPETGTPVDQYLVQEQRYVQGFQYPPEQRRTVFFYVMVNDYMVPSYTMRVQGKDANGRGGVFSVPGFYSEPDSLIAPWWPAE